MFRRTLSTYAIAAAILAFASAPILAQDKGARPNPSGGSSGGGSGRTASGGGGGDAGSSSGTPSGSTSDRSSPRAGASSPSGPTGYNTEFAPERPQRRAAPRDTSGQRPSSANADSSRSSDQQRRVAPGASASTSSGDASGGRRAVPTYARPREGRPVVGTATERRPVGSVRSGYYYDPYYRYSNYYNRYPYGYYYAGYGLGLGYFYDPFLWGYYSPYAYGGYPGYYGGGGGYYGGGGGGNYSRDSYREVGGLRLKVKPLQGQVYVDGYYVGEVDSYDGNFQRLQIEAGAHKVEIRADGFETVQFDVMITPGETVTYKGEMKRIQ